MSFKMLSQIINGIGSALNIIGINILHLIYLMQKYH